MDLSFVIVNYNTRDLLLNCLASIYSTVSDIQYEVFVVDNGSSDGSPEGVRSDYPGVRLLKNRRNLGFARANNLALKEARGRHVILLNSDAMLEKGAAEVLLKFMDENPDVAIGCGQLLDPDGSRQNSFGPSPTFGSELLNKSLLRLLFPGRFRTRGTDYSGPVDVEAVVGACAIVRRAAYEQVGLLDEDYFLFMEETDWCYRMRERGWRVAFTPEARIFHLQGATVKKDLVAGRIEYYRSRYHFFKKHWGPWWARWLAALHVARLLLSALLLSIVTTGCLFTSRKLRTRLGTYLGLIWWHLRFCPEGDGFPKQGKSS